MKPAGPLLCLLALACLTAFRSPPGAARSIELAEHHTAAGETELALEDYSRAIALEPQNPAHYTKRGFLLLKLQRSEAALLDFATSIRLQPAEAGGYLTRGLVYSELKREKEAEADFLAACRLGSRDGCSFAGRD